MTLPSQKEVGLPLLMYIHSVGGEASTDQCYVNLANFFELSSDDLRIVMKDNRSHWHNIVQWAKNDLIKAGDLYGLKQSRRGIWKITDAGNVKAQTWLNKIDVTYADEVYETCFEGAKKSIFVNTYERSRTARNACIQHYGYKCSVCNICFEDNYGEIGKDFIHVHHILPISQINEIYVIDPVNDLRPVCPNCHAMLHRKIPPLSIEELKSILNK